MVQRNCEATDPRIRRTRQLLQKALQKLLETKKFEEISVQDLAEAATVNRATFYDHFPDKFGLLECMVGSTFCELLTQRDVQFDGNCGTALRAVVLAVCDYLVRIRGCDGSQPMQPHMESSIISVLRRILLEGLQQHGQEGVVSPETRAAAASWAIYGAVKEWLQTAERCTPEEIAVAVAELVGPLLHQTRGEGVETSRLVPES